MGRQGPPPRLASPRHADRLPPMPREVGHAGRRARAAVTRPIGRSAGRTHVERPERAPPAAIVTRLLVATVDLLAVLLALCASYFGVLGLLFLIDPRGFDWPTGLAWLIPAGLAAIALPYLTIAWSAAGRTFGGALFGVDV